MPPSPRPLHTRLTAKAPRSAKIISRSSANAAQIPTYKLQVGGSTISNVGLDEIFAFVSPREYEAFENLIFQHEVEERDTRELQATLLREKLATEGRKYKHAVADSSDSDTGADEENEATSQDSALPDPTLPIETEVGRHGRPRPTYTHLYKRGRRGRGRARGGGGGVSRAESKAKGRGRPLKQPLGEEEQSPDVASVLSLNEPLKRRRIDPSSSAQLEGTLASIPKDILERPLPSGRVNPASFAQLESILPTSPKEGLKRQLPRGRFDFSSAATLEGVPADMSSADSSASPPQEFFSPMQSSLAAPASRSSAMKASTPSPPASKPHLQSLDTLLPASEIRLESSSSPSSVVSSSSSLSSSAYDPSKFRRIKPPGRPTKTPTVTIPRPTTTSPNTTRLIQPPPQDPQSSSASASESDSSSFEVERILTHRLSDPATHSAEMGKEPVMLYHVKWIGYEELTWEPVSSFDDQRVVREYWDRAKRRPGR
ncbi:hypothetical protein K461DRAFT_181806 [Myriangium duriaei CBS 260.36]|uniref:Chromo domain-containing protein n=1 Tax=Myriangium duriaei CBS 260.36 TaxID=1168546 RepID=A0A9P4IZY2_9PEZI|nr:hypothetical protein K461DRAFT_181806 [Myriangium duriaei CBS 260.36]